MDRREVGRQVHLSKGEVERKKLVDVLQNGDWRLKSVLDCKTVCQKKDHEIVREKSFT